jgi:hypothetical protein
MECWSVGVLEVQISSFPPVLHHSNTPVLHYTTTPPLQTLTHPCLENPGKSLPGDIQNLHIVDTSDQDYKEKRNLYINNYYYISTFYENIPFFSE